MLNGKLVSVMYAGLWYPADLADILYLKVMGQFLMAAGSPAFRYKSSLRSGLTAAIRLKKQCLLTPNGKKYFFCVNQFKSAGTKC
ncbi:hypothetical protein [uncultured Pedobacter sp.]|uniref:hypothetical protein n=1 Tax=uncultured Pedobacter sp. TaxID=246139 RepID=UPI0025E8F4AF|nr:hypothetical protein [uncultured Pedobacter sp.]